MWNRRSGPSQRCTVFTREGGRSKRGRSPRRTKLVELEHLRNREMPRFSRSARPEGSLSTGGGRRCRRSTVHSDTTGIGHYCAPISARTLKHRTGTGCYFLTKPVTSPRLTSGVHGTRKSNVNRESFSFFFFFLFFFPAVQGEDKLH